MRRVVIALAATLALSACVTDEWPQRASYCDQFDPNSTARRKCWEDNARIVEQGERERAIDQTLRRSGRDLREARERNQPAPRAQLTGG